MDKVWAKLLFAAGLAWCLAGLGILLLWGFFGDLDLPLFVTLLFVFAFVGGVAQYLMGHRHSGRLVFWCRRFGDTDTLAGQLNRWHWSLIEKASSGVALPVTLQDDSVDSPPLLGAAVFLPVFLVLTAGSLGSTFWILDRPWFGGMLGNIVGFFVAVLAVTLPSVLAIYGLRWIGSHRVEPGGDIARVIDRAARGRRNHAGALILRCRSEQWQACVTEVLRTAPLTIIDVSLLTDNVAWEVETAAELLGADRLLLLSADADAGSQPHWVQTESWAALSYDIDQVADEFARFTESWREDKHQLLQPRASLGPAATAIAAALADWMEHAVAGDSPG